VILHTKIRLAEASDLPNIFEIEKQFGLDAFSKNVFKRQVGNSFFCVLEVEGVVAGYYLGLTNSMWASVRLYSIAVDPAFQNRGYGKMLLENFTEKSRKRGYSYIKLEVAEHNPARHLYESLGYRQVDFIEDYYADGGPAIIMRLDLLQT
jgi:ribosomal-protein-alanine N-acetyltransferase